MAVNNYGAYGSAIGSVFGAFSTVMEVNARNDAIEAEAKYNIEKYKAQEMLSKFAITNNEIRSNQILGQIEQEQASQIDKTNIKQTEAMSKEVVRRSSGITAGASVGRSIDKIIKMGSEAKANINYQTNEKISGLKQQVSIANNNELLKLNAEYNNMEAKNAQLAGNAITGVQAALQISSAALNSGVAGYNLGKSIGNIQSITPDKPMTSYNQMDGIQFSTKVETTNPLYEDVGFKEENPFGI